MEVSSPKFKALAVSFAMLIWFFIVTSILNIFSIESFIIFSISVFVVMQLLALKVSSVLDTFAIYNTRFFLTIMYLCIISVYGILFRLLRIDLLRLQKNGKSYWLEVKHIKESQIFKQY